MIVYDGDDGLYVMNADGSDQQARLRREPDLVTAHWPRDVHAMVKGRASVPA